MRKFALVLQYELKEYVANKGFLLITLLFAAAAVILLFFPRVFSFFGAATGSGEREGLPPETETADQEDPAQDASREMILFDQTGKLDPAFLADFFPDVRWTPADSAAEVEEAVQARIVKAGFVVKSTSEYDYYVYNKGMFDSSSGQFEEAMKEFYRMEYCKARGLDYPEISGLVSPPVTATQQVLNQDVGNSYWYCYVLVILIFMFILLYGQMIAVSVTGEKSNRAIEVLVTSTTPNSLLFGKVIAGAIGGLLQAGLILGAALVSYRINREQWGGMLDRIFQIPANVLLAFACFGLGGYLFYAFCYGAVGALVSKTEDISKSSSGLMVAVMVIYFISLSQIGNPDGIVNKIFSFLPVSSYSTMFVRIAMNTVSAWEVAVSFGILVLSIFGAGFLGAKIYRMGTLHYGNPMKLRTALKRIRHTR
ncbi:MAG: ABC transporter permease [Clostridium sp.]|jgi:ABC-2 type transport system permease protein|nr:ABC transporter permease [Clostridium sp.]